MADFKIALILDNGRTTSYGLSTDTKLTTVAAGSEAYETDTGDKFRFNGSTWDQTGTGGATNTNVQSQAASQTPQGDNLYLPLLGTLVTYADIPSAVASSTTYIVDLAQFGSANIWVVGLTDGTEAYNVAIQYSQDGQAANAHTAAVEVIATSTVNNSGQITKKDRWAHIAVTQEGAAAKDSYHFYISGRELSE